MANNIMNDENKKKALDAAIAKLEKDFGKGAVMKLGIPPKKYCRPLLFFLDSE